MCNPLPQAYWESELCWRSEHLSASASSSFSSKPWDDPKVMTSNLCQNHQTTTSTPAPHPVSWCSHLKEIVCFPFSYFSLLLIFFVSFLTFYLFTFLLIFLHCLLFSSFSCSYFVLTFGLCFLKFLPPSWSSFLLVKALFHLFFCFYLPFSSSFFFSLFISFLC